VTKKISSMPSIKRLLATTFPEPHMKAAVKMAPVIFIIGVSLVELLVFTGEIIIFKKRYLLFSFLLSYFYRELNAERV
tara:strand:- start:340 stop:573 length:234 start_codon:yes stop_codon:yes gene_type:complete